MPFADLAAGVTLEYQSFGARDDAPVLLIPGAGAPAQFWPDAFCAALADAGHWVVRYSHRDTGASTHFDAPYDIDALLDDLRQLLDRLAFERCHLVGHSMGGYLVQLALVRFPKRIATATSLSAGSAVTPELHERLGTSRPEAAVWDRLMQNQPVGDLDRDLPGWLDAWTYLNGTRPFDRVAALAYTRELYAGDPRNAQVAMNHVHAMQTVPETLVDELPACRIPLLVLHGSEDPLVPIDNGRATALLAGNARFETLDEAGHMFFDPHVWSAIASKLTAHFRKVLTSASADLANPAIQHLLTTHTERALSNARCREGHALDLDALRQPNIEVRAILLEGTPVAVGALRTIDATHGELKSMFVSDEARGQGIGRRLLDHLVERARAKGISRLSLETGASDYFDAARALYARNGFQVCEAFADLPPHDDSVFMTRTI